MLTLGVLVLQRQASAQNLPRVCAVCLLCSIPYMPALQAWSPLALTARLGVQVLQRLSRARERQRVSTGGAAGPDDQMGPDFGEGRGDSDASDDEQVTAAQQSPARRTTGAAAAPAPGLSGLAEREPVNMGL